MPESEAVHANVEPFRWNPEDPLAAEHQLVSDLIAETLASGWQRYSRVNLSRPAAGKKILAADPQAGTRIVSSLLAHIAYFDEVRLKLPRTPEGTIITGPEFNFVCDASNVAEAVVRHMLRRKLPFTAEHLVALADWIATGGYICDATYPLESFVRAVVASGQIGPGETALRSALARLVQCFRRGSSSQKELPRLAYQLEMLLRASGEESASTPEQPHPNHLSPIPWDPAPVGSDLVLVQLKQFLGILPRGEVATAETGFDHFLLRSDSLLATYHDLINRLLPEVLAKPRYDEFDLSETETGRLILKLDNASRVNLLLAAAERRVYAHIRGTGDIEDHRCWQSQSAIYRLLSLLLETQPTLNRTELFDLWLYFSAFAGYPWSNYDQFFDNLGRQAEKSAAEAPFSPGERHVLHRLRCQCVRTCHFGRPTPELARFDHLLNDDFFVALVPGEAWSDAVNEALAGMSATSRADWIALLLHTATATAAQPAAKWLNKANELRKKIGTRRFAQTLLKWFPLVLLPRTILLLRQAPAGPSSLSTIHPDNATCLRGLLWMSTLVASPALIRAVGALTVSSYRKIPGVGPRAVKVGNAGVYALSQIEDSLALAQLAFIKVKVKFGTAQKEIEKAFAAAAERSGLPRDEIEEMSVPTYGLSEVGVCEEPLGEFTARLTVTDTTSTELVWVKPDGKIQRAVPAAVKAAHKQDLKELQLAARDIQQMLPAQRERIDSLFLQQKTWPLAVWKERYLDHPLMGTLTRRLLWEFKADKGNVTGIWWKNQVVDRDLRPIALEDGTAVQLWHPIGKNLDEVAAWRSWLDTQQIQQPFKQAHREIYLLTEAERNTRTYSNRYAPTSSNSTSLVPFVHCAAGRTSCA